MDMRFCPSPVWPEKSRAAFCWQRRVQSHLTLGLDAWSGALEVRPSTSRIGGAGRCMEIISNEAFPCSSEEREDCPRLGILYLTQYEKVHLTTQFAVY